MKLRSFLRTFFGNQQGGVLVIAGLTMLTLVAVGGAAIDMGRQQLLRAKLQQATDAAAIAVAAVAEDTTTDAELQNVGQRYFMLNFPDGYMGISRPTVSVQTGPDIIVEANVDLPTRFIKLVGIDMVRSAGRTRMSNESTTTSSMYDLILVMDVSGSMSTEDAGGFPRIEAQRYAANTIASNLLNPNTTNSRIAAVTWHDNVERAINFQDTFGRIQAFNNQMAPRSGTNSTAGLVHARERATEFRENAVKAVVLITDGGNGANVPPYSTYAINRASLTECAALKDRGILVYTIAFGQTINQQCYSYQCPAGMCNNAGVPYNVNDPDLCARPFLAACATTPDHFFAAPTAAALNNAFQSILTSVKSMRILD